jgi:S-adenosylmethionine:tRNA ribosyltransferase-isomerase
MDLPHHLNPGDLLVLNNSRVIPARLRGIKAPSGGGIEVLLLEENDTNDWWTMLRPGKRVRPGTDLVLHDHAGAPTEVRGTVLQKNDAGHCRIIFSGIQNILRELDKIGEVPLPPYIRRPPHNASSLDHERYQTVYATLPGSVAAPTAGLHFSESLLEQIREHGVQIRYVTLHVGSSTFAPVKTDQVTDHVMHEERYELSHGTADAINLAKAQGRRIFAVGTTTVRVLEASATANNGKIVAARGRTRIFIYPPYQFRIVDALLTNFHLPESTLLMLVSAFAAPRETHGRDVVLSAYAEAIRERYRFFSYGDAMLIL